MENNNAPVAPVTPANTTIDLPVAITRKGTTVGSRIMSASEYKKAHGLKGSAAKRQYAEYVMREGAVNTASVAAMMTTGEYLVTSKRDNKTGFTLRVVEKSKIAPAAEVSQADLDKAIDKMSSEELAALMAKLAEKQANNGATNV